MRPGIKFSKTTLKKGSLQIGRKPIQPGGNHGSRREDNPTKNSELSHKERDPTVRNDSDPSPSEPNLKWIEERYSPRYNLLITIGGIAIAESIAMVVVYFFRHLPYYQQVILDAAVMTVIITPLLFILSTQPLLRHIRQRIQTEGLHQARLRLTQFAATHTLGELHQTTVDEIEALTGSAIGFFHFLEPDQKTLWLQAWSTNTLQNMCKAEGKGSHYNVEQAGVWVDCILQLKPVIHNDYDALPHRKGVPEGHASVVRELAVPILRDGKVVAILGVGNKSQEYTASDVEVVSVLADFAWDIIERKRGEIALLESEEKFRTLVNWTYDWEIWLGLKGNVIYNSPSCKRITGYSPEEFIADPDLMIRIIHPDDRYFYENHQQIIHNESAGVEQIEYRVIARDGNEHWMEHVCRPLFGNDNRYLGRRVSNRDITERKQAEREIRERNEREKMLGQVIHTMQLDIARDLHDTIGQNISFLRMKLDHLAGKKTFRQADIKPELQNMTRAANETHDLIRGTLAILQSVNSTDLYRLFIRYAEQIEERSTFKLEFSSRGEPKPLSAPRMRQLFYIFRELLNNIEKHANASRMSMEMIWNPDCLNLIVVDNGKGFDMNQIQFGSHFGLKFMKERVELLNGSLAVDSTVGSGTRVVVQIPYE